MKDFSTAMAGSHRKKNPPAWLFTHQEPRAGGGLRGGSLWKAFFWFLCCDINSDILWYGNHIVFFFFKNICSSDISVIISMICYYINSIVVIYCNIWEFICKIPYLTKHIMVVLLCNGILGDIWCMYFSLWLCEQNAFWNILRHLNDAMMI
jgi:hypothetical protein